MSEIEIDHEALIKADIEAKKAETKRQVELNRETSIAKQQRLLNEAEQKMKDEQLQRQLLEQQHFGLETERQRFIRLEMQRLGDQINSVSSSSSYVVDSEFKLNILKEQYKALQQEYISTPFKLGKEEFRQVLVFESRNGDQRLESKDGGKSWSLIEVGANGYINKSIKKIEAKDNKPCTIKGIFTSDYIQRYFPNSSIPTITDIEIIENFEQPKITPRPRINFGWYCVSCKQMNSDDKSMKCTFCGAKRLY